MSTTVAGIYRRGTIDLFECPANASEEDRVIVTFLKPNEIDLASLGIGIEEAWTLRSSLATFAEDWDSPEMDIYDNYGEPIKAH